MENREKTKEQLTEDLRETREELAVQKWGIDKTLGGMKVLARELEEAKAKYEAILTSIGDGVAATDETGKLIFFNKNASDILGIDANQGTPDTWQDTYGVFDPVTFEPFPADKVPLALAVKGHVVSKCQLFIKNSQVPNGKFISVTATPIMLNGKSFGGVAIFRDITSETEKLTEVERLNKAMIGRELKMIELKKENEELKKK